MPRPCKNAPGKGPENDMQPLLFRICCGLWKQCFFIVLKIIFDQFFFFFKKNFFQNFEFFSSHKFNVFFFLNYYERFTVEIKIRGENVYHIFHSLRRFLTENTMHVCKVPDIPDTYAKKILFFVKNLLNKILNLGLGGQSSPNTKKNESIYFFSEFFYKNRLKRIQKKIIKIRAKKNVAPLS